MSDLEDGIEGFNKFTNEKNFKYKIYGGRGSSIKSLQLTFGSFLYTDLENIQQKFSLLKYQIKQFFHRHIKDGYYKKRYHFIPHMPESFNTNGKGYCYFEVFLFLEETYDKKFVYPYFKDLCEKLDVIIGEQTQFTYHKVKQHKLLADN